MRKAFCDECEQEMSKGSRGLDYLFEPKIEGEDANWVTVSIGVGGQEKPTRLELHKGVCLIRALDKIAATAEKGEAPYGDIPKEA